MLAKTIQKPEQSASRLDTLICYAANAIAGLGGQGEFLRQMMYALDRLPHGRVLSRGSSGGSKAGRVESVVIELRGWRGMAFRSIAALPSLRRRHDVLTLLSDVDFDEQLSAHLDGAGLFDGVMGQCCRTFERLSAKNVPLVLTALNTHLDGVTEVLADEHRRLAIHSPGFIHPGMRERVHGEIERATCIRAVSRLVKQSFVERGVSPDKVRVVLPAIDLEHFQPVAKKDDVFRVLAVASIDARKGIYYLLKAFEKAAIPNSELRIIGATGDPWSRRMLEQFTSRLSNIGIQSADVVKEPVESTYGPASVFVHPAIEDGFGLAVGQALACGKPVITTRQTGASELIVEGENGYVIECRDVDGLVDRLKQLARDESLLARLSAAGPGSVAHLGYPQFGENVGRFYDEVQRA